MNDSLFFIIPCSLYAFASLNFLTKQLRHPLFARCTWSVYEYNMYICASVCVCNCNCISFISMFVAATNHTPTQTNGRNEKSYFPAKRKYHLTVQVWAGGCKFCSWLWIDRLRIITITSEVIEHNHVRSLDCIKRNSQGKSTNKLTNNMKQEKDT